jgi:leucyl aminopeptidase
VEFSIKPLVPGRNTSGCTVVGIYAGRTLSDAATAIDRSSKGYLKRVLQRGDMEGRIGTTLLLHDVPGIASARVLLVGLGAQAEFGEKQYRRSVTAAVGALANTGATDIEIHLAELTVARRDIEWKAMQAACSARTTIYRFEQMKSKPGNTAPALSKAVLSVKTQADAKPATRGLTRGLALAHGVNLARDLGNLPGNVCTPTYLADAARKLAKAYRLKIQVLERADMKKLGMNTLLSAVIRRN